MKAARQSGLKIMLDGQGGDESVLSYERYYAAYFWHLIRGGQPLKLTREFRLAAENSRLNLKILALYNAYFLCSGLRASVLRRRARFLRPENIDDALEQLRAIRANFLDLRDLQTAEIMVTRLPHLLRYEDRTSMAHSIEARVPFVDQACIGSAVAMSPRDKIREGYTKFALRGLADQLLPETVAWRREKSGFEAPDEIWYSRHREHMQETVDQSPMVAALAHDRPRLEKLTGDLSWRLYNLAAWERIYNAEI